MYSMRCQDIRKYKKVAVQDLTKTISKYVMLNSCPPCLPAGRRQAGILLPPGRDQNDRFCVSGIKYPGREGIRVKCVR